MIHLLTARPPRRTQRPLCLLRIWVACICAQVKADRASLDDIDEMQRTSVLHHAQTHAETHGVEVEELVEEHKVVKKVTRPQAA